MDRAWLHNALIRRFINDNIRSTSTFCAMHVSEHQYGDQSGIDPCPGSRIGDHLFAR